MIPYNKIIQHDCLKPFPLPDKCVQCVITSPPYWGLRDYDVIGQLGLEETPEEYVQKMVGVFREVRRVLRDDGTVWLNLGDSYAGGGGGGRGDSGNGKFGGPVLERIKRPKIDLKPKNLVGIPWMIAFALRADGWYLRSDIIWSKPNPMPESVTDRPTKAHEYIFLLTKSAKYFFDQDAVRTKSNGYTKMPDNWDMGSGGHGSFHRNGREKGRKSGKQEQEFIGANIRTVWEISTQSFSEAHFATFPEALVERCMKAGSKKDDIIFDPFMGSGTVAKVALRGNRRFIGLELKQEYIDMAMRRIGPLLDQVEMF